MALSEAQEGILLAVDGMTFERRLPTPARIGLEVQPPLTTPETMVLAAGLARDGYLEVRDDGDGITYYELTSEGRDYCGDIMARGT